jgi:hypothetical protein
MPPFAIVAHAVLRPIASALEAWPTDAWAELEPRQAGMDGTGLRLADEQIPGRHAGLTGIVVVRQNALVFAALLRWPVRPARPRQHPLRHQECQPPL